jgi:putative MATE family efflux protein
MTIVRHMNLDPRLLRTLIRIGIPTGLQMVMVSLAEIAVISLVNRFGSSATAAYGAVNQIVSYVQFPAISIGIGASIFGAQSIGAKRFERLRGIARAGIALNWGICGALIVLVYVFNDAVLSLFITDPAVVALAHDLLTITLWSYAIFGTSSVLSGLMRSSGDVLWPTALSITAIWAVEVPVAYALAPHYGLRGVWIAYPVAFCCSLLFQTTYYFAFWRRKRLTTLLGDTPAHEPVAT